MKNRRRWLVLLILALLSVVLGIVIVVATRSDASFLRSLHPIAETTLPRPLKSKRVSYSFVFHEGQRQEVLAAIRAHSPGVSEHTTTMESGSYLDLDDRAHRQTWRVLDPKASELNAAAGPGDFQVLFFADKTLTQREVDAVKNWLDPGTRVGTIGV